MNSSQDSVLVIMSVYNGELYLREQMESILDQTGPAIVDLLIRDDGSTDTTSDILNDFASRCPERIKLLTGPNLGAAASFMSALAAAPRHYNYYALSDSDDVWLHHKLATQIASLKALAGDTSEPALLVSRMEVVGPNLEPWTLSSIPPRGFSFRNALSQTVVSGASSLMNNAAHQLVTLGPPKYVSMHDSWIYLVVSARGSIYYSETPVMKYRQHGNNVFGVREGRVQRSLRRLRRLRVRDMSAQLQLEEFDTIHGSALSTEDRTVFARYLRRNDSFRNRMSSACARGYTMQSLKSEIFQRFVILLGKS